MKNLVILISIVLFASCATLDLSVLRSYPKNETLLPTLEPDFDMYNLENAYNITSSRGTSTTISTENDDVSIDTRSIPADPAMQDVITLFKREVRDNITLTYGDSKGIIRCTIAGRNAELGSLGWTLLSAISLYTSSLIGLPISSCRTAIDVDVEIYNNANKIIGRYNAQGKSKIMVALYYGYSFNSASRLSNINAFKAAMADIKKQIQKDANRLILELNK